MQLFARLVFGHFLIRIEEQLALVVHFLAGGLVDLLAEADDEVVELDAVAHAGVVAAAEEFAVHFVALAFLNILQVGLVAEPGHDLVHQNEHGQYAADGAQGNDEPELAQQAEAQHDGGNEYHDDDGFDDDVFGKLAVCFGIVLFAVKLHKYHLKLSIL